MSGLFGELPLFAPGRPAGLRRCALRPLAVGSRNCYRGRELPINQVNCCGFTAVFLLLLMLALLLLRLLIGRCLPCLASWFRWGFFFLLVCVFSSAFLGHFGSVGFNLHPDLPAEPSRRPSELVHRPVVVFGLTGLH